MKITLAHGWRIGKIADYTKFELFSISYLNNPYSKTKHLAIIILNLKIRIEWRTKNECR